ncbi:predicted protein [Naegleria gruberi]|uniref:Predicted protein n=1 Tax=Naegleria gruberi TaxID=5762 RepID=D2VLV3_NAEGR|nr:uncharacterized protein NAEGRDRAFT_69911 [Naegleria gruberi]EFC42206.1 predicted protein [Naegleria gruberi]|eukprot:XP_002674950.1 predicted protein [Naegleria gruberi strain NEG-M]
MPPNFLKKSWSDLMGSKSISVRLSDLSHRFNMTKDEESTCSSPTSSDVSYLSSPPTSPTSSNAGLKIRLSSAFSCGKRNSASADMSGRLDTSFESIESGSLCIEIPKEGISNFTKAETPEFSSVMQVIQHYKKLESFCFCMEGKKMLIQSLRQQQKDEQVSFIQLIDNIANNMTSDSDRVTEESLRGICLNICDRFLRDGSECQLNVSNRFIRKFERDLNNALTPKEDYLHWIDSILMDVIVQINTETYPSIKKSEEFRIWLLIVQEEEIVDTCRH